MKPVFALLTDFGLTDPYVAQMKSVLLSRCPECRILDVSHAVKPQNILQAGFFLSSTWRYLPGSTICIAVVDPGVGTDRRILLLEAEGKYVFFPDNGLISLLLEQLQEYNIFSISYSDKGEISSTFHGRDVFAPVAAKLVNGYNPKELGDRISVEHIYQSRFNVPEQSGSEVVATIVHIDQFGNCILNLSSEKWSTLIKSATAAKFFGSGSEIPLQLVPSYARIADSGLGILNSSQGFLELAMNRNSCAGTLNLSIGDSVTILLSGLST